MIFRDPLFSQDRERSMALCPQIERRGLSLRFECETRLDRLDPALLDRMHAAGLRAMSFGVESLSPNTLKKAGRRPIPTAHQRTIVDHCRKLGVVTAAFYVFGFLEDDWTSIGVTIDYSVSLGSTFAQFKLLTPYPGTPLWKQMAPRVFETDWQNFDGFTPAFHHPALTFWVIPELARAAGLRPVFVDIDPRTFTLDPQAFERTIATQLIQAPIHSSLTDAEVGRVGQTIRDAVLQITREVETHMPAERSA